LLAFATFLSVEQNQRMIRETRQDLALETVRNWANESLRNLSRWEPNTLLGTLASIEAQGFTAVVAARGASDTLQSNVRAAVACCVTLRDFIGQSEGLPAETGAKVDQLMQHLRTVISSSSQWHP
jgi:hypothetical protein